jgi:2-C-methyl-D-erythritol 4-phosphate cytidylyltransferase
VHDAARPGITPELIRKLVAVLRDDTVGGILALPLADTLKRVAPNMPDVPSAAGESEARIARTESRDGLWQAQTPQMFRLGMLREAIERARHDGHDLTDEASAVEWLGHSPKLVQGSLRNFKVTYPEDFALAGAFLSANA